ncbi:MAG: site-specific integrase [Deltaproteobacteria bacterium]|nr:site-specific integrase [Deltaproteobacteria bacterium]
MVKDKNHHMILRGDTWYFVTKTNGRRIRKALSQSITEARRIRDEYLRDIKLHGDLRTAKTNDGGGLLFGEIVEKWVKITIKKIRPSTMIDYKSAMNTYLLPRFGNTPIAEITYLDIEEMISELECSAKRINNILVPLRSVFKLAYKNKYVKENIMLIVENHKINKPKIAPLSMDEVRRFLDHVNPFYRPFFTVAFFTGMRGGEMAALKWENVHLDTGKIDIVETRVYGEEGRPKTEGSYRTIDMLPMVRKSLLEQAQATRMRSKYVFLNMDDKPVDVETLRKTAWTACLKEIGIKYRPMIQTRHTFATLMVTSGENIGWVQKMMGHTSLKMIIEKYFAYIPNMTHNDGSLFVKEYEGGAAESTPKVPQAAP